MTLSREQKITESKAEGLIIRNIVIEPVLTLLTSFKNGDLVGSCSPGIIRFFNRDFFEHKQPIHCYNISTKTSELKLFDDVNKLAILSDHQVVSLHSSNEIYIHDLNNRDNLIRLEYKDDNQFDGIITFTKKRLIAASECSEELSIKIWNEYGDLDSTIDFEKGICSPVFALSPEENLIFSVRSSEESKLYIWNSTKNITISSIKIKDTISQIVSLSEEFVIAKIYQDISITKLLLIDIKNHKIVDTFYAECLFCSDIFVLPNGTILLSYYNRKKAKATLFEIENNKICQLQIFDIENCYEIMHVLTNGHVIFLNSNGDIASFEIPSVTKQIKEENNFVKVRQDALSEHFVPDILSCIINYDSLYSSNRFFSSMNQTLSAENDLSCTLLPSNGK